MLAAALLLVLAPLVPASSPDAVLVPITSRAIAAVALDHLPDDTTRRSATYIVDEVPATLVSADLRYASGRRNDEWGDLVRVTVGPHQALGCGVVRPCASLASPPGTTTTLQWSLEEPEEDPGYVRVVLRRGDEEVVAHAAGAKVVGDPRLQPLPVSIDLLVAVAQDPRLRLRTTRAVVAAGSAIEGWRGPPSYWVGGSGPATSLPGGAPSA